MRGRRSSGPWKHTTFGTWVLAYRPSPAKPLATDTEGRSLAADRASSVAHSRVSCGRLPAAGRARPARPAAWFLRRPRRAAGPRRKGERHAIRAERGGVLTNPRSATQPQPAGAEPGRVAYPADGRGAGTGRVPPCWLVLCPLLHRALNGWPASRAYGRAGPMAGPGRAPVRGPVRGESHAVRSVPFSAVGAVPSCTAAAQRRRHATTSNRHGVVSAGP